MERKRLVKVIEFKEEINPGATVCKYLFSLLLSFFLLLLSTYSAVAATDFAIEQAKVYMPEIQAFFYDNSTSEGITDSSEITATLGGKKLEVIAVKPASEQGTAYYFMLDLSTSMAPGFNAAKNEILQWHSYLGPKDKLLLITFGEEVKTVLNGHESQVEIEAVLNSLKCNHQQTRIYDALTSLVSLANTSDMKEIDRKIALVISDGIELKSDSYDGGVTLEELNNMVTADGITIYAMCLDNPSASRTRAAIDSFGKIARDSGGAISQFNSRSAAQVFADRYSYLEDGQVMVLMADSNIVDDSMKQLTIRVDLGDQDVSDSINLMVSKWRQDEIAPQIIGADYLPENNVIRVVYSEPVSGADRPENYRLIKGKNKRIELSSVSYSDQFGPQADLILTKPAVNGDYILTISNVADISMEKNLISRDGGGIATIKLSEGRLIAASTWWLILGLLLLIALGAALFLYLRNKKAQQSLLVINQVDGGTDIEHKYHVSRQGKKITLQTDDGRGQVKTFDIVLAGSMIIGRSDICDLYFDDGRMSRQHCALEDSGSAIYITDLETLNGTFVNGVKITGRRAFDVGDVILAGETKIRILDIQ